VRGSGSLFRKGNSRTWTIQFYKTGPDGKRVREREATGLTSQSAAQKVLTRRLDQVERGELIETRRRSARISELYEALHVHYLNDKRPETAQRLAWQWKLHLAPSFANLLAAGLTTDDVAGYTRRRQEQGASNATINRELSALRRMFNLGRRTTPPKVRVLPYIPLLKEDNTRTGFVDDAQFARLAFAAEAGERWLRLFLELAFSYGWRKGELLTLRVRQVDIEARSIRLDPGSTKNREGREVAMTSRVATLLREAVRGKKPEDFVLTRKGGKPVKDFRKAWRDLCVRAGLGQWLCRACAKARAGKKCDCGSRRWKYAGLIIHDFRRSAAKALRAAGVAESVIMAAGGWKTAAMFRRYAIVSSADQRAAVEKLEAARAANSPRSAPFSENQPVQRSETASAKVQ